MALYWILAFLIAWAITLPGALAKLGVIGHSPLPFMAGVLIGVAPIAAAMIVTARDGQFRPYWKSLWRLPNPWWTAAVALLLPPLMLAVTYAVKPIEVSFSGIGLFALLWLVLAFGEEAGWRAYALPRLVERYGFWVGSLILGIVWCVWHYPKMLGNPYVPNVADLVPLIGLFSLQIVLANFIICWLYFRSGRSVIATTLFHTCFNIMSTAYAWAAADWVFTSMIALIVVAIFVFDRNALPKKGVAVP